MRRILLTGGRAPATLELARLLQAAGHEVFVAESMPWPLTRFSRAVTANFRVPPPRFAPAAFIEALIEIARREQIDCLIPTCEEIYTVAHGRERLAGYCSVFAADLVTLHRLHHKGCFVELARQLGLAVPETRLVYSRAEAEALLATGREWVFKPVYSRAGSQTIIRPRRPTELARAEFRPDRPWLAQAFVAGRQLCTFSLAHQGRLTAHAAYATEFCLGAGSTVRFAPLDHPAARAWVEQFVAGCRFTGQIAFDFIEQADQQVIALECNPRLTSGIHLFHQTPLVVEAFFGQNRPLVTPGAGPASQLGLGMLFYAVDRVRSPEQARRWWQALSSGREIVFQRRDPLPGLGQGLLLLNFLLWQLKHRVSGLEALTLDIEWNGEGFARDA